MTAINHLPPLVYVMCKRKQGYSYLIKYDRNDWDPLTKRAVKVNQVTIGKILSGDGSGVVRFTPEFVRDHPIFKTVAIERYLSPLTNKWEFRELSQEATHKVFTSNLDRSHDAVYAVRSIGTYMLYMKLLSKDPLLRALQDSFPDSWDKLLSVAFYCVDWANGCKTLQYNHYCESTKLPYQSPMSAKVLTNLFKEVTQAKVISFLYRYTKELYGSVELSRSRFWALDSTSVSTYSKLIDASWGKNKQDLNIPQVNLMMLADQRSGRPLYYEMFDGSIPDVKKAMSIFEELLHIGARSFVAVMDRGFYSLYNLDGIINLGYHFLVCVPIDKVKLFKESIMQANQAFLRGDKYCSSIDQNVFSTEQTVTVTSNGKRKNIKLYVHVFYDQERAGCQTKNIQRRREEIIKQLHEHATLDADNQQFADTYLTQDENGCISLNNKAFQEASNRAGIFVVVSDIVKKGHIAYMAYRDRKVIEDCFRDLKVKLNFDRFYVSDDRSLVGKCFVEFIAVSLFMSISHLLQKAKDRGEKLPHLGVPSLIGDLKGIKAVYHNDGYVLIPTLSKRQTECLRLFSLKPPSSGYHESCALPNMIRYARKPHGDGSRKPQGLSIND